MEIDSTYIKNLIMFKRVKELVEVLNSGWDPNADGGWPIRLAARYGCYLIVETFIQHGANPHLVSESGKKLLQGASTLQLAVFSGEHWDSDRWTFLLSCCDSSQLADGAAVAIIFNITTALTKILETGRCNTHIPTTLTGKTLEELARGYKLTHLLSLTNVRTHSPNTRSNYDQRSPRTARPTRSAMRQTMAIPPTNRNLSPSVARFFQQTAGQPSLSSPRNVLLESSPTSGYLTN